MSKSRIFLIHGWGGFLSGDWLPWAKTELENRGYEVIAPLMPDTDAPVIQAWVNHLDNLALLRKNEWDSKQSNSNRALVYAHKSRKRYGVAHCRPMVYHCHGLYPNQTESQKVYRHLLRQ